MPATRREGERMTTELGKLGFLERAWAVLRVLLGFGAVVLIWTISFNIAVSALRRTPSNQLPDIGDLTILLFGAATIAIILLVCIFTVLSLVGWQSIKTSLARFAEAERAFMGKVQDIDRESTEMFAKLREMSERMFSEWRTELDKFETERIRPFEIEAKARIHSVLGYALGAMSITPSLEVENVDLFKQAIKECDIAYRLLEDRRGSPLELMILNNLLFHASFLNDLSRTQFFLMEARRLLAAAQAHNHINFILTACGVIIKFSSDDNEKSSIRDALEAIRSNSGATERERRDAEIYLGKP